MLWGVSLLAMAVGAAIAFAIGALWYGPFFGRIWAEGRGYKPEDLNPAPINFVINGVGWLIGAFIFGALMAHFPDAGFGLHLALALLLWIGFTAPAMVSSGMWNSVKPHIIAIDVGYPLAGLLAIAIAFALLG